jgi:hypothetical protein
MQVLLEESDLRDVQRIARARHMTVAEWVRQTLREARRQEPVGDVSKKLAAIRRAARHAEPTADIETMNAEITRGYTEAR